MKILMFAGPGCVGKTTQLNALVAKAEELGKKVCSHKSSTRRSYEEAGLTSESDALRDPEFNQKFQDKVYEDNFTDLVYALDNAIENKADLFICDRTPFDYIAYYFTVFSQYLTIDRIEEKRDKVRKAMNMIYDYSKDTQIVPFLYPVHWSKDTNSSDGWRADKTGKNFVWGSIIQSEIKLFEAGYPSIPRTPESVELTEYLLNHCFPSKPPAIEVQHIPV